MLSKPIRDAYKLVWGKAKAKVLGSAKSGASAESFLTAKGQDKVRWD